MLGMLLMWLGGRKFCWGCQNELFDSIEKLDNKPEGSLSIHTLWICGLELCTHTQVNNWTTDVLSSSRLHFKLNTEVQPPSPAWSPNPSLLIEILIPITCRSFSPSATAYQAAQLTVDLCFTSHLGYIRACVPVFRAALHKAAKNGPSCLIR